MILLVKKEEKAEAKEKAPKKKEEKDSHKAEKASGERAKKEKKAENKAKEKKEKAPGKEKAEEKPAKKEKKAEKEEGQADEKAEQKEERPEEAKQEKQEKEKKAGHQAEKPEEKAGERPGHFEKREKAKKKGGQKPNKSKALKPDFVDLKPKEITEAIIHLANEGHSQSEIGMILRNQYGVPKISKALGKKLSAVLEEQKLLPKIPEDLMNLVRKSVTLREHMERNKKDMSAKRGLMLTVSKIRSLEKYYKLKGKLPMNWRYTPETAALLAK